MPQDLIGCRKSRKLKALIPYVVVFVNDPPSAERRIDFAVFFVVLWSYGRKIYLNMRHGNSENSYGYCSYLLGIALFTELMWLYSLVLASHLRAKPKDHVFESDAAGKSNLTLIYSKCSIKNCASLNDLGSHNLTLTLLNSLHAIN